MTSSDNPKPDAKPGDGHSVLSDRVRKQITELIRNRSLAGGQVIIEQRLAETLGVSRTPLREALQRLEGEGLIQKNSGRSHMIRVVGFQEYMQSLKMRRIIEPEAAAGAIGRIPLSELEEVRREIEGLHSCDGEHTQAHWDSDDRLHRLFGRHCGNAVMHEIIEKLRVTTRLFEITEIRQKVKSDFVEHIAILNALAAEDADTARRAVAIHITSLIDYSVQQVV